MSRGAPPSPNGLFGCRTKARNQPLTTASHLWYTYFCRNRQTPARDVASGCPQGSHRAAEGPTKDREPSNEAKMPPKAFLFTHFRKNASANHLVSYTFKTK